VTSEGFAIFSFVVRENLISVTVQLAKNLIHHCPVMLEQPPRMLDVQSRQHLMVRANHVQTTVIIRPDHQAALQIEQVQQTSRIRFDRSKIRRHAAPQIVLHQLERNLEGGVQPPFGFTRLEPIAGVYRLEPDLSCFWNAQASVSQFSNFCPVRERIGLGMNPHAQG
jgi:hypothetical protein